MPVEHGLRRADECDGPVPEVDEVRDGRSCGGLEVEVDAREPARVAGQPDEDGRLSLSTEQRQSRVVGLDVHHDDGVHHGPGRHPLDARVVVLGQQQRVVLVRVPAVGGGDAETVFTVRRDGDVVRAEAHGLVGSWALALVHGGDPSAPAAGADGLELGV
ncbi:hypothetical protein [Cellulomonas sp. HZM]|uniref:hypothetical protein n=1 Tax=Cellulomonas sp. HZM TaxID=1454010 RepID=UPI00069041CC|nr:hypothetical protein [Cellulomonas sp. HZM]